MVYSGSGTFSVADVFAVSKPNQTHKQLCLLPPKEVLSSCSSGFSVLTKHSSGSLGDSVPGARPPANTGYKTGPAGVLQMRQPSSLGVRDSSWTQAKAGRGQGSRHREGQAGMQLTGSILTHGPAVSSQIQ